MPSDRFSRPASLPVPFDPSDRAPAPEAVEKNTDTAWDLFESLAHPKGEPSYAPTAPASVPMPLGKGDRRYADTVPSALTASAAAQPVRKPVARGVTVDEVMVEARRNNRLCPMPLAWQHVYELLPNKKQGPRGWEPQPPLSGSALVMTPSLAKRMCLRDHIEWAGRHGGLDDIYLYLKGLPETDWHHMGD